jgi:hypothetical protein
MVKLKQENNVTSIGGQIDCRVLLPYYDEDGVIIYNTDYRNVIDSLTPDVIITDPPYPNYLTEEYNYYDGIVNFLTDIDCRQFIFWTKTQEFPLDFTAKHKWNKITGTYSNLEYIYERNGSIDEYEFRYQKLGIKLMHK